MGNCVSDTQPHLSILQPVSPSLLHSPDTLLESCCFKDIDYIRTHFPSFITEENQKHISAIEHIVITLASDPNSVKMNQKEHLVLFKSVHQQIKLARRRIENEWKEGLSDYNAFVMKCQREHTEKLDIFQLIKVPSGYVPAMSDVHNINFPTLSFNNRTLINMAKEMLRTTNFCSEQGIKPPKLEAFMRMICRNYNVLPYHNFSHAFSVYLMIYQSYTVSSQLRDYLTSFDFFYLLVAAIAHDLNHEGKNNAFFVKKRSDMAISYNNQSVLQNMHISTLFRLMEDDKTCDLFEDLGDPSAKGRAKKQIIKCILATDMTNHFSSLANFKKKIEATKNFAKAPGTDKTLILNKDSQEDKDLVMETLIHACDIGNPCLEHKNYINWALLLAHQFDQQNKEEIFQGFEETPMLKYVDRPTFFRSQMNFCKQVVLPLWKQLSCFSTSLRLFTDQVQENISILEGTS